MCKSPWFINAKVLNNYKTENAPDTLVRVISSLKMGYFIVALKFETLVGFKSWGHFNVFEMDHFKSK